MEDQSLNILNAASGDIRKIKIKAIKDRDFTLMKLIQSIPNDEDLNVVVANSFFDLLKITSSKILESHHLIIVNKDLVKWFSQFDVDDQKRDLNQGSSSETTNTL